MSGQRTSYLTTTRDTLARIADEAQAKGLAAENALASLEDRESRRATRRQGRS